MEAAKWLGVGGHSLLPGVGGHSLLPGTFLPRCVLGHKMILERLDFKIMITVAGGLLMAASLLMCFIICLSYKVAKSVKEEKTVRMANTPHPQPLDGTLGLVLERGHPRPCGRTLGEVRNGGRV